MFLTMLGGSLALGAGLLAAASYSEGTLVALRTVAQVIGWLFVFSTALGLEVLRRGHLGGIIAAAITLACGLGMLYVSYFQWEEIHDRAMRHATAEVLAPHPLDYKLLPPAALAAKPTLASLETPAPAGACAALTGVESLQCRRCGGKLGLAWIACQESARLEYCEGRPVDEASCPSPIPYSHPG